ncbi:MAG: hypothetical protein MSS80_07765 [Mollicutes bacterium]|nr:hypothetical protein [Mollicutes bacterium]
MFDLSKEACNTLRFIIVSENEDKIEETVLNILYIFWIKNKEGIKVVKDLQRQKNDIGRLRDVDIYIDKNYHINIAIFPGIKCVKGQRAPFVIIDKDIEIEEYDIDDIMLPVTEIHDNTKLFTNGKGYVLI